jgi:hypothetical protein
MEISSHSKRRRWVLNKGWTGNAKYSLYLYPLYILTTLVTLFAAPGYTASFDNDAKADIAVYRPGSGYWFILRSSDGGSEAVQLGVEGDTPVPGDYDGDGKIDVAVYRSSSQYWFIIRSSDGGTQSTPYGIAGDLPMPGDYDGDGKTDIAIYRPAYGYWFILRSSDGATEAAAYGEPSLNDAPVPGDYDGDGKTDIAIYRAMYGYWFVKRSSDGATQAAAYGEPSLNDQPMPGDYDGDGKTDFAIYRAIYGYWFIKQSSDGATHAAAFGEPSLNDQPVRPVLESGDLGAIRSRLNELQQLFNDNNANATTLDPFIDDNYLDDGETKSAMIDSWTAGGEGPAPGGAFTEVRIAEVLNPWPKTVMVSFVYDHPSGPEAVELVMHREGTVWKLYGDQRIMELKVRSKVLRETWAPPTPPSTFNGLSFNGDDYNGAAAAVQSIVVTGPGLPPAGITMNRIEGQSYFATVGLPYNIYNIADDAVIGAISDGAVYTFDLYDAVDGSGSLLYTYSIENPKRPYLWTEITDSLFPQMTSPASHALSAANPGGKLAAIFSKPAGYSSRWAGLSFWNYSGGTWYGNSDGPSAAALFDSAGMGFAPVEGMLQIDTEDRTTSRVSGIVWHYQSPGAPFSIQVPPNGNHLYFRDSSDGTKGYWYDVPVRNPDGSLLTNQALIQDFRCYSYPAMTEIPPSGPWTLFQTPYMYSDGDGNGPNLPAASPYSAIEGYLDVPAGTLPQGFALCVVTDNTGQQQLTWLYHAAPTEVDKVQSASMGTTVNGDGSVTLSWIPPAMPPLDPAKHVLRLFVNSYTDYSGDGQPEVMLVSSLPGTSSSYTIPASEVARLRDFTSLYWYVQPREMVTNVTNPGGVTRMYFTYRNYGQTLNLTLPQDSGQPVASFTANPNPSACGQMVTFNGSSSYHTNPGRSIVSYDWTFGDGATGNGAIANHAYGVFGSYEATLTVTDDNDPAKISTDNVVVDVNQGNQAPIAYARGPYTVDLGNGITLDGTFSTDPDAMCGDSIVSYSWDIANGAIFLAGPTPSLSAAQVTALGAGTHPVRLTVTDEFGASSFNSSTITVN